MIKQKKLLIGLGALLVVCLVAVIAIVVYQPKDENTKSETVTFATYESKDDILAVTIKNENGEYMILNKGDDQYGISDTDDNMLDTEKLSEFMTSMTVVNADGIAVEDGSANLADYGLENPAAVMTLVDKEQSGLILNVGNMAPDGINYYAKLEGSNTIYLINTDRVEKFFLPKGHFLKLQLFPSLEGEGIKSLTGISISDNQGNEMAFQQTGVSESVNLAYYAMTVPVELEMSNSIMEEKILTPLTELTGDDLVSSDGAADRATYGMDAPRYTLNLTFGETNYTVFVGKEDGDNTYVMEQTAGQIYKVAKSKVEFLATTYQDMLGSSVYEKNITTVETMTLTIDGKSHTYSISGEGNLLEIKEGDQEIDSNKFMDLYNKLMSIPMEGDVSQQVTGQPRLTLELQFRDSDKKDTLSLTPLDDRTSAITINGASYFYCYTSVITDLASYVDALYA